jgi:hypothetical protein
MLMDEMDLRTGYGWRIRVEWGQPNAEGIFEPLFHSSDDGKVLIDRDVLAELERRVTLAPTPPDALREAARAAVVGYVVGRVAR